MKEAAPSATAIALAISGLALLGVILSAQSNTSNVIITTGQNFARAIRCAMGPIIGDTGDCGTTVSSVLSFPSTPSTPVTLPTGTADSTITYGGLD